jgi:hypothetical protein
MRFKPGYLILYLIFLALGATALISGLVIVTKNLDLKFNGVKTKGIILGAADDNAVTSKSYLNGRRISNDAFFARIRYLVGSDSIESSTHSSINGLPVAIGDEVNVVYRPNEPEYVELPQMLRENLIAGGVCTLMGLVFTGIMALLGYRSIQMKRQEQQKE